MEKGIDFNKVDRIYKQLEEISLYILSTCEALRKLESIGEEYSEPYFIFLSSYQTLCQEEKELSDNISKILTIDEFNYFCDVFLYSDESYSIDIESETILRFRLRELILKNSMNNIYIDNVPIVDFNALSTMENKIRIELYRQFTKRKFESIKNQIMGSDAIELKDELIKCKYLVVAANPNIEFNLSSFITEKFTIDNKFSLLDKPTDESELYTEIKKEWQIEIAHIAFNEITELLTEDLTTINNLDMLQFLLQQLRTALSFSDDNTLNLLNKEFMEVLNSNSNENYKLIKNKIRKCFEQKGNNK